MLVLKTNLKKPDGLRYAIKDRDVAKDPKTGKWMNAPFIEWDTTSPVNHTADDVVQSQTERKTPRLNQAITFLRMHWRTALSLSLISGNTPPPRASPLQRFGEQWTN